MTSEELIRKVLDTVLWTRNASDDNKEILTKVLVKKLEQEPRWIPVSERLPEVGHRVIFSMKNDEIYIGTLHTSYNDLKITLELTGIGYVYSFENVVAWMPLPQPYKAESEG